MTESEKNLTENYRTKLHVNTKRPIHSHPDTFYSVIRFIDFDKYPLDQRECKIYHEGSNTGVIVASLELKKKIE